MKDLAREMTQLTVEAQWHWQHWQFLVPEDLGVVEVTSRSDSRPWLKVPKAATSDANAAAALLALRPKKPRQPRRPGGGNSSGRRRGGGVVVAEMIIYLQRVVKRGRRATRVTRLTACRARKRSGRRRMRQLNLQRLPLRG